MDNATQALLIAGGILLGILTVTLLVYMFNNMATLGNAEQAKKDMQRLKEWNGEWEAYNKSYLYGAEVLTVINKAEEEAEFEVKIQVLVDRIEMTNKKEYVSIKKTNLFTCKLIEYSEQGRVNKMVFEFVE